MTSYGWVSVYTGVIRPISYRDCLTTARGIVPDLRVCIDRWQPDPYSGRAYQTVHDEIGVYIGTIVRYDND